MACKPTMLLLSFGNSILETFLNNNVLKIKQYSQYSRKNKENDKSLLTQLNYYYTSKEKNVILSQIKVFFLLR